MGEIRRLTKFASQFENEFVKAVIGHSQQAEAADRKLTPLMLNKLIEKIEVFNAEKVDGVWEQRLRIHYNCVGAIEIPDLIPLPAPEVSVNTSKGVVVNYALSTIAG